MANSRGGPSVEVTLALVVALEVEMLLLARV
jgi:hypothetical protein